MSSALFFFDKSLLMFRQPKVQTSLDLSSILKRLKSSRETRGGKVDFLCDVSQTQFRKYVEI
jgi:hypothetical protein